MPKEKPPVPPEQAYDPSAFYSRSSSNRKTIRNGEMGSGSVANPQTDPPLFDPSLKRDALGTPGTFDEEMWAKRTMVPPTPEITTELPSEQQKKEEFFRDLGDGS